MQRVRLAAACGAMLLLGACHTLFAHDPGKGRADGARARDVLVGEGALGQRDAEAETGGTSRGDGVLTSEAGWAEAGASADGGCSGSGMCLPDEIQPCGYCGKGTRTCTKSCTWNPCVQTGCDPGTTQPCGNCLKGTQTCNASCTWGLCSGGGVCLAGTKGSCGNCNTGTRTCTASCAWGSCSGGGECASGNTQTCPNGCGNKTCNATCTWGSCSLANQLVSAPYSCWSSNHCGTGLGKCVGCYQRCDGNGNLSPDDWCSSCTTCAGKLDKC